MKIVMTLLARNEADIIDAHLAFHLNAGVDFIVAIDNGSSDGTTEVFEEYARSGHVHLIRRSGQFSQMEWVTEMARRAATEFNADWVINSDADEFWWPRGGSLKDVFAAVPTRFGIVRGMWRHFAPAPGDEFFAERMIVRVVNPGAEDNSPYSARFKAAHRGDPDVEVTTGNHQALGRGLEPLRGWYPIDVLHFPIRSLEHFRTKYLRWWELLQTRFSRAAHEAESSGRMREFYEEYVIDEQKLTRGIANGTLAVDTRLRDALRSLGAGQPLVLTGDEVDDAYLTELAALGDADPAALAQRKADDLEARLAAIERRATSRLANAVRRVGS